MVASEIGGLADIVQHGVTGLGVPPGDELALGDAISHLLAHRSLAERLGNAGRARAQELFALDASLTRVERLYD